MRYYFSTLILFIFSIYWSLTLIFTSPSNFINISLLEYSYVFETFFFQKWAFFAPPPNSNDRLYYYFENKKNKRKIKVFEVIEPITKNKCIKAPFNTEEDILDYVLSNTVALIRDDIVNINEIIKYRKDENKEILKSEDILTLYQNKIEKSLSMTSLKKYSFYISKKNKINLENYRIKIIISSIEIPKFIYRNNQKGNRVESIIYESKYFNE